MNRLIRAIGALTPLLISAACGRTPESEAAPAQAPARSTRRPIVSASRRTAITEAVATVAPSVVTVQTEILQRVAPDPFDWFFGGGGESQQRSARARHRLHRSHRWRDRHQRARRRRRDAGLRHDARRNDLSREGPRRGRDERPRRGQDRRDGTSRREARQLRESAHRRVGDRDRQSVRLLCSATPSRV